MDGTVSLRWEEQTTGAWFGMRGNVTIALVATRSEDGAVLWGIRRVNTHRISKAGGEAASVEEAKRACQDAWDRWCAALELSTS